MNDQRALSVSELNEYVRRLLAGDALLRDIEVTGEISGYKLHISGHRYFALKDAGARVQCVMFRQHALSLSFQPQDGMKVTLRGSASLYPSNGSFQLYVTEMRKQGVGELYERFEKLKRKLSAEGLFDPAIKRELPLTPTTIGVATSQTGAAIRDILRVARRRNPRLNIIIAPCTVQGEGAAEEIVRAIERLNEDGRAEVILCGRGGGSIEDLWAFNEEIVARAIANSRIPVVSCVGHETDFSIADFVADVRAATPSMAAELAVPMVNELKKNLSDAVMRVKMGVRQSLRLKRSQLDRICFASVFQKPRDMLLDKRRSDAAKLFERCKAAELRNVSFSRARFERTQARIGALNPRSVLGRGFAYVTQNKKIKTRSTDFASGSVFDLHLMDGSVHARVLNVSTTEVHNEEDKL